MPRGRLSIQNRKITHSFHNIFPGTRKKNRCLPRGMIAAGNASVLFSARRTGQRREVCFYVRPARSLFSVFFRSSPSMSRKSPAIKAYAPLAGYGISRRLIRSTAAAMPIWSFERLSGKTKRPASAICSLQALSVIYTASLFELLPAFSGIALPVFRRYACAAPL